MAAASGVGYACSGRFNDMVTTFSIRTPVSTARRFIRLRKSREAPHTNTNDSATRRPQ
jgi:hypothetical protein